MPKRFMLRDFRKRKGWTLEEASSRFGISLSYLSELETGKMPMTLRVAKNIEAATAKKIRAVDLLDLRERA